jgi:hypothetical protein
VVVVELNGIGESAIAAANVHVGGKTVIGTRHYFLVGWKNV